MRKLRIYLVGCFLLSLITFSAMAEVKTVELLSFPLTTGQTTNYSIESFRLICQRAGFEPKITFQPFIRALDTVSTGHNMVMMTVGRIPDRENMFKWITKTNKTEYVFASINGKTYDLTAAKTLGSVLVHSGTASEKFLVQSGFTNTSATGDVDANAKKLASGRGDVWLTPIFQADRAWAKGGYSGKLTYGPVIYVEEVWMVMSPGSDQAIADALKKEFDAIKADGTFQKIVEKYSK